MKNITSAFLLLALTLMATKCNEVEPPRAIIKVVDAAGVPVRQARVVLFCPTDNCIVSDTAFTNVAGESEHQFDLPAVLQIDVYKLVVEKTVIGTFPNADTIYSGDTTCGNGYITLREDEVVTETIVIQRCE